MILANLTSAKARFGLNIALDCTLTFVNQVQISTAGCQSQAGHGSLIKSRNVAVSDLIPSFTRHIWMAKAKQLPREQGKLKQKLCRGQHRTCATTYQNAIQPISNFDAFTASDPAASHCHIYSLCIPPSSRAYLRSQISC